MAELADFDAERVACLLMADIYNAYGFDAMSVRYINMTDPNPRIKARGSRVRIFLALCRRRTITEHTVKHGIFREAAHNIR